MTTGAALVIRSAISTCGPNGRPWGIQQPSYFSRNKSSPPRQARPTAAGTTVLRGLAIVGDEVTRLKFPPLRAQAGRGMG